MGKAPITIVNTAKPMLVLKTFRAPPSSLKIKPRFQIFWMIFLGMRTIRCTMAIIKPMVIKNPRKFSQLVPGRKERTVVSRW